jgi:hypothetical protein
VAGLSKNSWETHAAHSSFDGGATQGGGTAVSLSNRVKANWWWRRRSRGGISTNIRSKVASRLIIEIRVEEAVHPIIHLGYLNLEGDGEIGDLGG